MQGRLKAAAPYAALLAGAAYLFHDASRLAYSPRPGQLGPDFWPKAVLILLMLASGWQLLAAALSRPAPQPPPGPASGQAVEMPRHPGLLALGAVATLGYVLVLPQAGFFASTALYLALFMLIGRYRRLGVVAATSLAGSLAFMFVFMRIVYVSLPLGIGPFQRLSLWILALLGLH